MAVASTSSSDKKDCETTMPGGDVGLASMMPINVDTEMDMLVANSKSEAEGTLSDSTNSAGLLNTCIGSSATTCCFEEDPLAPEDEVAVAIDDDVVVVVIVVVDDDDDEDDDDDDDDDEVVDVAALELCLVMAKKRRKTARARVFRCSSVPIEEPKSSAHASDSCSTSSAVGANSCRLPSIFELEASHK